MRKHGASAETVLPKLRVVPEAVWLAALGVFSVLYLAFFFVQGRYLFGAFTRTLPESFTVAEYARQGFFELCRVMAINFTLFWLRPAGKQACPLDDGGASDREYALRRRRPVQARALYRLLRLHAQAPAEHMARLRPPVRQRLRALYAPDRTEKHAHLDDLRCRHACTAVHLVNCRGSAEQHAKNPRIPP